MSIYRVASENAASSDSWVWRRRDPLACHIIQKGGLTQFEGASSLRAESACCRSGILMGISRNFLDCVCLRRDAADGGLREAGRNSIVFISFQFSRWLICLQRPSALSALHRILPKSMGSHRTDRISTSVESKVQSRMCLRARLFLQRWIRTYLHALNLHIPLQFWLLVHLLSIFAGRDFASSWSRR